MPDRLTAALDSLDALAPTVTWADVMARASIATDDELQRPLDASPHPRAPRRRRMLSLVAAAGVVAVLAGVLVARDQPAERSGVITSSGPSGDLSSTSTPPTVLSTTDAAPAAPPTTRAASGTAWASAVNVWTGREYLVWGGQVGGDGYGRADGWRYDPATGTSVDIPVAPIPPRDSAAGVWTGTELIVCCGFPLARRGDAAYNTATAAAFDPATNRWRRLADPPPGSGGHPLGVVWTGSTMLVVTRRDDLARSSSSDAPLMLFAYEPATDTWITRAAPPRRGGGTGELAWTGSTLVLWERGAVNPDTGAVYDPTTDAWTDLPAQPDAHPVHSGSVTYLDGQVIVWGIDARDHTRSVGYRLRIGDPGWRTIAPAPLPIITPYEGSRGSQALVVDQARSRIVVWPVTGSESGAGGVLGPLPPLYAYAPRTDTWTTLVQVDRSWYAPELTVGGATLLRPDRSDPVVTRFGS